MVHLTIKHSGLKDEKTNGIWGTQISDKPGKNWDTRIGMLQPYIYILQKHSKTALVWNSVSALVWTEFFKQLVQACVVLRKTDQHQQHQFQVRPSCWWL